MVVTKFFKQTMTKETVYPRNKYFLLSEKIVLEYVRVLVFK